MRIALVDTSSEAFELHRREGRVPSLLIRTVAHVSPELLDAWLKMAWGIRRNTSLTEYIRELIVLRVVQLTRCEYEFSHHWGEAAEAGMSEEKLRALSGWEESVLFDDDERALLRFVDEVVANGILEQATFDAARRIYDETALVEIVVVAGFYGTVARVLNTFEVPLEDGMTARLGESSGPTS